MLELNQKTLQKLTIFFSLNLINVVIKLGIQQIYYTWFPQIHILKSQLLIMMLWYLEMSVGKIIGKIKKMIMGLSLYVQDLQQSIYNLFSVQCCKISGHRNYINRKQSFWEDLVFYLEHLLQTYFRVLKNAIQTARDMRNRVGATIGGVEGQKRNISPKKCSFFFSFLCHHQTM